MSFDTSIRQRILTKLGRFLSLFEEDPERRKFEAEYTEDLRRQARSLQYPGAILGMFVWLGFAFETDQKLHPEFPELFYFRIGFSIVSFATLCLLLLDTLFRIPTRQYSLEFAYVFVGYLVLSTSFFTGRIADDPNYVSGLQIVLIMLVFLPLPRRIYYIALFLSVSAFLSAILIYSPNIRTPQASYSLQNLAIAYLIAFVFSLILERYRFVSFVNRFKILASNKDISEKMLQIQTLKEKQDGDYFLTSLLLSPLIKSEETPGSPVRLEFLLDQYKKFSFKSKDYELGGDYLSAYRIRLRDQEYTAFINGDAMGKSIQGAGGALVLGSVFNSIISRTRLSPEIQSKSPERWLKETFVDLQNVFETFDGFMLVSAILGILDHKTGTLFFINAEHPWPVLFRDGKATFLDTDSHIHKIGISELFGRRIQVQTFRMAPGDRILCGSDGRDDLILEQDFSGKRVMNEDETQFLHAVEESEGDLKGIRDSLLRKGKLSDDLSLVSIHYRPKEDPYKEDRKSVSDAETLAQNGKLEEAIRLLEIALRDIQIQGRYFSPLTAKHLSKFYEKNSRFEMAARTGRTALDWDPSDTNYLFTVSLLWKKAFAQSRKKVFLTESIELGERLRSRSPSHLKNLVNLADSYRISENLGRARKLFAEAKSVDSQDPKVLELERRLG